MLKVVDRLEQRDRELASTLQTVADSLNKVDLRYSLVEARLAEQERTNIKTLMSLEKQTEKLSAMLSGTDESAGLTTRVDRLEQRMLGYQRVATWIFGGGLAAFVATMVLLLDLLHKIGQHNT